MQPFSRRCGKSLANETPIVCHRVTNLPDFVYFNHAIHIAKCVGCARCYGNVKAMPLMDKAHGFTMGRCLECYRDPAPQLRPKDPIFNTDRHRTKETPSPMH
jgi:hypothetical protein